MKPVALALARSRIGGWALRLAFGRLHKLLPLRRLQESRALVAFWHPAPAYPKHILIVPKRSLASIAELSETELAGLSIEAVRMARQLARDRGLGPVRLVLNAGKFQETAQLHFHLLPGSESRRSQSPLTKGPFAG